MYHLMSTSSVMKTLSAVNKHTGRYLYNNDTNPRFASTVTRSERIITITYCIHSRNIQLLKYPQTTRNDYQYLQKGSPTTLPWEITWPPSLFSTNIQNQNTPSCQTYTSITSILWRQFRGIARSNTVFPKIFARRSLLTTKNNQKSSHHCWRKYTVSGR
jgi:hypothetical protein